MYMKECPLNDHTEHGQFSNFFNWTVTYRRDSDFPFPYGKIYSEKDHNTGIVPTNNNLPDFSYVQGIGKHHSKYFRNIKILQSTKQKEPLTDTFFANMENLFIADSNLGNGKVIGK